jgi:hypothetical protein
MFTLAGVDLNSTSNNFSVVVTSASGSVTSSVANIHLQLPPVSLAYSAGSNLVTFAWGAVSNLTYQLQFTTNLVSPVWQNLGIPVVGTNGSALTSDIPSADAQRFYRVRSP